MARAPVPMNALVLGLPAAWSQEINPYLRALTSLSAVQVHFCPIYSMSQNYKMRHSVRGQLLLNYANNAN